MIKNIPNKYNSTIIKYKINQLYKDKFDFYIYQWIIKYHIKYYEDNGEI